jgi:hypothetical protein
MWLFSGNKHTTNETKQCLIQLHRQQKREERGVKSAYNDSVAIGVGGNGEGGTILSVLVKKDAKRRTAGRCLRHHRRKSR